MGRVWGVLLATFLDFFSIFSGFLAISRKNLILEGFRGVLGRVWGGFWGGFGRVWERLGRCWELPWLLCAVFRDFRYFLRRKRAERRERSERCEAPGLLLVIFRYFLLFLIVFGCFVIVWAVFGCGRVWEPLGYCWTLPGLLYAVFRDFLYFGYFWRRCRAERRERSERCEAPGRLFAVF